MRLLIIEDDRQLAGEMKIGLERQGFTIDIANTGLPPNHHWRLVCQPGCSHGGMGEREDSAVRKKFDILLYLVECHPKVVSSEGIIEHTYNEEFDLSLPVFLPWKIITPLGLT